MTRARRLLGNFGIFALGQLLAKLLALVLVPVYTHYLPMAEFGQVDAVITTVELLIPLLSLCLHEAVLRYVVEKASDPTEVLSTALAVILGVSVVALVAYPIVTSFVSATGLVVYGYAILVSQVVNSAFAQYARGIGRVKVFAGAGVIQALALGLSNIVCLIWLGLGVDGYLISLVVSLICSIVFLFFGASIWRVVRPRRVRSKLAKSMLAFSLPLIPNGLLWWFTTASHRYFLIGFHGLEANGLYAVSNKLPMLVMLVTTVFNQAWQLSAYEEVDAPDAASYYSTVLARYQGALWVAAAGLLMVVQPIVTLTFATEYHDAWEYAPALIAAVVFSSMSAFIGTSFTATKRTSALFTTTAVGALVAVGLNLLLIPPFGVWGASISMASGFFVLVVIRTWATRKSIRMELGWRRLALSMLLFALESMALLSGLPNYVRWPVVVGCGIAMSIVHRESLRTMLAVLKRPHSSD